MILKNKPLTEQEFNTGSQLYNKRMEYMVQLGEIKLSELENERRLEEIYTNIVELNTKEKLFQQAMFQKYGDGQVDLVNRIYVKGN